MKKRERERERVSVRMTKGEGDSGNVNGCRAETEPITIPREPGVYFSICKRWLHYPEFNRSRTGCGCIKVTIITSRMGRKAEVGAQIM